MKFTPGDVYHVYNQGNNNERLFLEDADYLHFLELFNSYLTPYCETLSWCLMPNHFHFLIHTDDRCNFLVKQGGLFIDPVTNGIRKLLSSYTHKFNRENNRSGSLFRPKTKAKNLNEEAERPFHYFGKENYYLNCFNYIHQNPVEAGLVKNPEEWKWSSYQFYYGSRQHSFCNKHLAETICGIK